MKVLVPTLFVVIVGSPVFGQTCQLTSVKQSDPPSAVLDIVQNGSVMVLTENYDTQDPDFIAFICLDQDEGNSPTCEAVLPDDEGAMIMEAYPSRTEPELLFYTYIWPPSEGEGSSVWTGIYQVEGCEVGESEPEEE